MPRPRSVTILCIILAGLALQSGLGAAEAWRRWIFLGQLPLSVAPAYLLAREAVWAVVFGLLAAGLWWRQAWARPATVAACLVHLAQGWVERLVLARAGYVQLTLGWSLLVDAVSLVYVFYALRQHSPKPGTNV
jgi:hypothetical protein